MRDPIKFTTFVLGSFVFVYYLTLGVHAARTWMHIGRCPIPAFTEGGLGNMLHAAAGLLGPLPVLAWAWDPRWFGALSLPWLDGWASRMIGLFALCAAMSIGAVALAELGDEWRMGVEHGRSPKLVTSGIYASIRHPIYTAVLLAFLGVCLVSANAVFAAMWLGAAASLWRLARREEAFLSRRLGAPYQDYLRATHRFLP